MFAFCVDRFHMSESMTAKRIWAARTARRFPVIWQMLARGELHLSAIVKIARHLTEDNHREVLARATHKSSREIDLLIAEMAPRPDVPSRIRALPRSTGSAVRSSARAGSERTAESKLAGTTHGSKGTTESPPANTCTARSPECATHGSEGPTESNPADACTTHGPEGLTGSNPAGACATHGSEQAVENGSATLFNVPSTPRTSSSPKAPRPRGQIVPLAPRRYKIEITVDQQTHDNLRMLQDLLGHQPSDADPAIIVSRALDRLLAYTLKKKAAVTGQTHPGDRRSNDRRSDRRTRTIPAAIRREVWRRDSGRCTFVDEQGHRCRGTRCMEYHHEKPYGKGGQHETDNIALRCRAHNQYQADLDFGIDFMRGKRGSNSQHSAGNVRGLTNAPL